MKMGLKPIEKSILITFILMFGVIGESMGQIFLPRNCRKLEAKYREMKQKYDDCNAESRLLKGKNDSLLSKKIILTKIESFHSIEAIIRPEIPGGFSITQINPKVMSSMSKFGDAEKYIEKKLYDVGFTNAKRFLVNGGFGMASDIEKIKDDGTSEELINRFDLSVDYSKSPGNFLERIFFPRSAGKTRMFLFIVSNQPFDAKGPKLDFYTILDWLMYGQTALGDVANTKLDSTFKMQVLVYEYEIIEGIPEGKLNHKFDAIYHLKKANIWEQEMGL